MRKGLITAKEMRELTDDTYIPSLRLIDYSIVEGDKLRLYTHAPVDIATIFRVAEHYGIEVGEKPLNKAQFIQMLDAINIAFHQDINQHRFYESYSAQAHQNNGAKRVREDCPLYALGWNRQSHEELKSLKDEEPSPEQRNPECTLVEEGVVVDIVHGHIGYTKNNITLYINLDTDFGRPDTKKGEYRSLVSNDSQSLTLQAEISAIYATDGVEAAIELARGTFKQNELDEAEFDVFNEAGALADLEPKQKMMMVRWINNMYLNQVTRECISPNDVLTSCGAKVQLADNHPLMTFFNQKFTAHQDAMKDRLCTEIDKYRASGRHCLAAKLTDLAGNRVLSVEQKELVLTNISMLVEHYRPEREIVVETSHGTTEYRNLDKDELPAPYAFSIEDQRMLEEYGSDEKILQNIENAIKVDRMIASLLDYINKRLTKLETNPKSAERVSEKAQKINACFHSGSR